jgi:F-type H+-transporting ATPase subunit b
MIAVVWAVLATPAFAADKPADDHGHGAKKDVKSVGVETGLFMGAIEVSLWTIVVFLTLLYVLHRFAWGPISEGLAKREKAIAQDKHEAILAKQEAADARQKLQAELAKANDEIRSMMDKARQDAQKTAADELAKGKAELTAERDRLTRDLEMQADQAKQDIWKQGAQLGTLISSKVIKKHLSYDDHRALLDEALNEFRSSLAARKSDVESARA